MKTFILITGLLIASNVMGQFSQHRDLLIFGSEENKLLAQKQQSLLTKSASGVSERAINIIQVEKGNVLYNKYKIDSGQFTVILIGKDGYEKYRTTTILETDKLFSIIDAMPMRRSEMKKTNNL